MLNNLISKKKGIIKPLNLVLFVFIFLIFLLLGRDILSFIYRDKIKIQTDKGKQEIKYSTFKDYEVVVRNNPFSVKKTEPYEIKASQHKTEQKIDYKLIGTIAGDKHFGYAIFMDAKGTQEVVKIGRKLEGLGILHMVHKAKVTIKSDDGSLKDLVLADIVTVQELQPISTKTPSDFARQTGEKTFTVDQRKIQHAIENPNQIMTDARLLPNFVDGVQKGFVLKEVKPGGIYYNLGLRDGDVLLRINEYNINNPESGLQAFMALKGLERINLDIIRGGSNTTLTYLLK